jgi:hypothetical protein
MDIYAKEISKMQSVSKSSATTKKRNFDATQFNTYGLPLGKSHAFLQNKKLLYYGILKTVVN